LERVRSQTGFLRVTIEISGYVMEIERSRGKKRSMIYCEHQHEIEQENSHVILIRISIETEQ
jgi:hypothetical protein